MISFARCRILSCALLLAAFTATTLAVAQDKTPQDRLRDVATKIDALMVEMAKKAEADKALAKSIAERKVKIEQAEQNVQEMIARLTELTNNMDDGSDLGKGLKDFEKQTVDLIAYAGASNDAKIKGGIPDLQQTLARLRSTDTDRSKKVQEARTLIRELEDNKTRIAFFYKAGQLREAAEQMNESVKTYSTIVDGAKAIAATVMSDVAAR